MRRTKIVCTLGPAVGTEDKIRELIAAGMNVARLNCSHGDWPSRLQWIEWVRKHSPDLAPVGILVDLQGPKFRIGELAGGFLELQAGQTFLIGPQPGAMIPVSNPVVLEAFEPGCRLLLGDGEVELKLIKDCDGNFEAKAVTGGKVKNRQGLTVVGKVFQTECLSQKDLGDLEEAVKADVDYVALSYVHKASDLETLKALLDKHKKGIKTCAKIETRDAIKNIDEIVRTADIVMVARGDMGLQMDLEDVPLAQKRIIRKCQNLGKPVITATQMLESMITAPRPTRAEATDVANAILDGTDAVMLSAETAAGAYPVEAVRYMARIAEKAESGFDRARIMDEWCDPDGPVEHTQAVAHSVAQIAMQTRPKAILTTTTSGQTARLVSKFRPKTPIFCGTWDHKTYTQLSVVWGVEALHMPLPSTTDEQIENALDAFKQRKRLKNGDLVVVSAGVPAGTPGNTNLIMIQVVK